jgi:hypothetical protein
MFFKSPLVPFRIGLVFIKTKIQIQERNWIHNRNIDKRMQVTVIQTSTDKVDLQIFMNVHCNV